jgi:pyruvate/2-oxoglutarate dehydrogenase complex dihydrolipoamide dehydrogenase (E3) component
MILRMKCGHMRTSVEKVCAVGDCVGSQQFTRVTYDDYRTVRDNRVEGHEAQRDGAGLAITGIATSYEAEVLVRSSCTALRALMNSGMHNIP